jgi:hypothetical protein
LQAGRIDIVLHFRQTYELYDLQNRDPDGQHFGPRLLVAAFGQDNYCSLRSLPEAVRNEYQSGLLGRGRNRWIVDGLATAVISPSPWWTDGFAFEAQGRYLIRNSKKILATADFYIQNQSITDVRDLFLDDHKNIDNGSNLHWIDLLIRQTIVRDVDLQDSPIDKRFAYESDAVFRIYFISLNHDGVFMIAPVRHEIGIMSPRVPGRVYSVGCVQFADLASQPKIFDVRNRDSMFRTRDYPELLRRAGIHEHVESFSPQWYGHSCASDEQQPLYHAGSKRSAEEWTPDPEGKIFERLFDEVDDSICNTPVKLPPRGPGLQLTAIESSNPTLQIGSAAWLGAGEM